MKQWIIGEAIDHVSDEAIKVFRLKRLPVSSVIFVTRGMILAHSWPIATTSSEVTINQDMKAIIVKSKLIPAYLSHLLRALTPQVLRRVETAAHGTKRLKTETVLNLKMPCPSMETQRKIVAYLDATHDEVKEMQRIQADDRSLLEQVEQSILAQAFRGEL